MRREDRIAKNARSTRARHNLRINSDKKHVMLDPKAEDVEMSDGTLYRVVKIPFAFPLMEYDEEGNQKQGIGYKSRYVRVSQRRHYLKDKTNEENSLATS